MGLGDALTAGLIHFVLHLLQIPDFAIGKSHPPYNNGASFTLQGVAAR